MQLHNLTPLTKKRKRVGRGGSRGGTSGKGSKGQKARSGGKVRIGFEGGQMPLQRRLPKRGFNNAQFASSFMIVNLDDLERAFQEGQEVTKETLIEKNIIKGRKTESFMVKVLGNGKLNKKLTIAVDAVSEAARKAIEECGGQVRLTRE